MDVLTSALVWLAVIGFQVERAQTPSTRLFVRSVPPGARIILDGTPLGESDGLFIVAPGVRKITVELQGYYPEGRQLEIEGGWITRVELQLRKRADVPKPDAEEPGSAQTARVPQHPSPEHPQPDRSANATGVADAGSLAAAAHLGQAEIAETVRGALLTVLRQHPSETRWSGRSGSSLFAVAVKPLLGGESGQRAVPAMLELTHMLAVQELLRAKSLLDRYAATGLTDGTTLRQAVERAAGTLQIIGRARGLVHGAAVHGQFAVAYVIAEEDALTANLLQPTELEKVRGAYRDVMHRQARELMARREWQEALLLWHHLHQRKLVSQQLYLDAALCFKELGQKEESVHVLTEAVEAFAQQGSPEFFEQAGDLALAIPIEPAQTLAEKVYRLASRKLEQTVSQPEAKGNRLGPAQE